MTFLRSLLLVLVCFYSGNAVSQNVLRVSGNGLVQVAPDGLSFTVTIRERGPLVSKIFPSVNEKTEQVVSMLQKHKVESSDIQSMHLQVHPWIEYENQSRVQKGFELIRQIQVTLKNTDNVAILFDQIFRVGNLEIGNISMLVSEQQSHYQSALTRALMDAKVKAKEMAATLNIEVGKVLSVTEITGHHNFPQAEAKRFSAAAADSFLPGESNISASVEVQFAID